MNWRMGACFIPDLFVIPLTAFDAHPKYLLPADVLLIVEILSEHNRGRDLVLKRHYYASAGIFRWSWTRATSAEQIWVIDSRDRVGRFGAEASEFGYFHRQIGLRP